MYRAAFAITTAALITATTPLLAQSFEVYMPTLTYPDPAPEPVVDQDCSHLKSVFGYDCATPAE